VQSLILQLFANYIHFVYITLVGIAWTSVSGCATRDAEIVNEPKLRKLLSDF
jgi:hypothetical protein